MSGSKVKGFDCLPSGWPSVAEATDGVTCPTDQITRLPVGPQAWRQNSKMGKESSLKGNCWVVSHIAHSSTGWLLMLRLAGRRGNQSPPHACSGGGP